MSHTKGKKGLEFETVMSVVPGGFFQTFLWGFGFPKQTGKHLVCSTQSSHTALKNHTHFRTQWITTLFMQQSVLKQKVPWRCGSKPRGMYTHVCTHRICAHSHVCVHTHIYIDIKQNYMFLFAVKFLFLSLTNDYLECHGTDMLGLKSCLIREG